MNRKAASRVLAACLVLTWGASTGQELNVIPGTQPARPCKPYPIVCEVTWEGDPGEYVVLFPEIDSVDWGTVEVKEARTFVRDNRNVIAYTIVVTPRARGEFQTPEIALRIKSPDVLAPPFQSGDSASPTPAPTAPDAFPPLRADPFTLRVYPNTGPIWIAGGFGALFLFSLAAALVWRKWRRDGAAPVGAERSVQRSLFNALSSVQESKRYRLEGDYYQFYRALATAAELAGSNGSRLASTLHTRAQEVGYRGIRPTADQMDRDAGEVERLLAEGGKRTHHEFDS